MATQRSLSRGERRLLWAMLLFLLLVGGFTVWWYSINAAPVVTVPTPTMPHPNARDFYDKAYASFIPFSVKTAYGPYSLNISELAYMLTEKSFGTGPGIARLYHPEQRTNSPERLRPSWEELRGFIRSNALVFTTLRQGFRYDCQAVPVRSFRTPAPKWIDYQTLTRCLEIDARLRQQDGDWNGMANDELEMIRFGRDLQHGANFNGMYAGFTPLSMGRRGLWQTIDHLTAAQARTAATRMEEIVMHHTTLADALQEEEWSVQASLLELFHQPDCRGTLMHMCTRGNDIPITQQLTIMTTSKRRMLDAYTRYMDALIANAKLPYAAPKTTPPLPKDLITVAFVPQLADEPMMFAVSETQNSLLAVSFALRAFKLEHGKYPKSLKELVPSYLHAIPADPFAINGSVLYKLNGDSYLLYSVGPDGKDNGGKASADGVVMPRSMGINSRSTGDIVAGVNVR